MVRMRRRNKTNLPTPIHRTFNKSLSLGGATASAFTKGTIILTTSFHDIPTDETNTVSEIPRSLLVGNTSIQVLVDAGASFIASVSNIELTVMKIPADYMSDRSGLEFTLPQNFAASHPEWVVATRFIGRPSDSSVGLQYQPISVSGRKRVRLYRGDVLAIVAHGDLSGVNGNLIISGVLNCRTRLD